MFSFGLLMDLYASSLSLNQIMSHNPLTFFLCFSHIQINIRILIILVKVVVQSKC